MTQNQQQIPYLHQTSVDIVHTTKPLFIGFECFFHFHSNIHIKWKKHWNPINKDVPNVVIMLLIWSQLVICHGSWWKTSKIVSTDILFKEVCLICPFVLILTYWIGVTLFYDIMGKQMCFICSLLQHWVKFRKKLLDPEWMNIQLKTNFTAVVYSYVCYLCTD